MCVDEIWSVNIPTHILIFILSSPSVAFYFVCLAMLALAVMWTAIPPFAFSTQGQRYRGTIWEDLSPIPENQRKYRWRSPKGRKNRPHEYKDGTKGVSSLETPDGLVTPRTFGTTSNPDTHFKKRHPSGALSWSYSVHQARLQECGRVHFKNRRH